jgi:hypothetical protein
MVTLERLVDRRELPLQVADAGHDVRNAQAERGTAGGARVLRC